MSRCAASWLVMAGTLCNVFGIMLGVAALVKTHREWSEDPFFSWFWAGLRSVVRLWRRVTPGIRRSATIDAATIKSGSMSIGVPRIRTSRIDFQDGATDRERIDQLVRAIEGVYSELSESQAEADRSHDELRQLVSEVGQKTQEATDELKARLVDAAVGEVRLEVAGLVLIAVGTLLAVAPTAYDLLLS